MAITFVSTNNPNNVELMTVARNNFPMIQQSEISEFNQWKYNSKERTPATKSKENAYNRPVPHMIW